MTHDSCVRRSGFTNLHESACKIVAKDTMTKDEANAAADALCDAADVLEQMHGGYASEASQSGPTSTSSTMRVCSTPGCPTIYDGAASRCPAHRKQAEQAHSRKGKGYKTKGHLIGFRAAVLRRDPICVLCGVAQSTVADHYPLSRVELIEQGLDPNDPIHGRGLDKRCHDRETALHQPGGWNARD